MSYLDDEFDNNIAEDYMNKKTKICSLCWGSNHNMFRREEDCPYCDKGFITEEHLSEQLEEQELSIEEYEEEIKDLH